MTKIVKILNEANKNDLPLKIKNQLNQLNHSWELDNTDNLLKGYYSIAIDIKDSFLEPSELKLITQLKGLGGLSISSGDTVNLLIKNK